ncbi:MAG: hypothetical protein KF773_20780 [Deltaproteobacteria bacterium]|nr:hypothetical protein [Deltaproteobacteria bacterium]
MPASDPRPPRPVGLALLGATALLGLGLAIFAAAHAPPAAAAAAPAAAHRR